MCEIWEGLGWETGGVGSMGMLSTSAAWHSVPRNYRAMHRVLALGQRCRRGAGREPSMAYIYPIPCRFWWGLGVGDRESEAHGDALYVHGIAQRTTEPSRYTSSADVGQKRQRGKGGGRGGGLEESDLTTTKSVPPGLAPPRRLYHIKARVPALETSTCRSGPI